MALQFIIQTQSGSGLSSSLGGLAKLIELFPIADALWGMSVPANAVNEFGEGHIRNALAKYNYYDLYAGEWHYA